MFRKKKETIYRLALEAQSYADSKLPKQPDNDIKFSIDFDAESHSDADKNFKSDVRHSVRISVFDDLIYNLSDELRKNIKKTFVECMLLYIDSNKIKDSSVYKAAGIDRRLYSKIISDKDYKPSKDTCIALCLGLKLDLFDFKDLLGRAGYTLSESIKRDMVIEYLVKQKIYDVDYVNRVLAELGLKTLGS